MASSNTQSQSATASQSSAYSTIELHTPTTLIASPHLPALFNLINRTFDAGHNKDGHSLLPQTELARLETHSQLGEEVGPDGFILIMLQSPSSPSSLPASNGGYFSPSGHRVMGTASARPYVPTHTIASADDVSHSARLFKRPPPPKNSSEDDGTPQWEILAMVVDPPLQGRGLATQLMNLTIDEIRRRCGSGLRDSTSAPSSETVMLLLSTMKSLNESYYAKRGWTTTENRYFPPGTKGSRDGFTVVEMFKSVAL